MPRAFLTVATGLAAATLATGVELALRPAPAAAAAPVGVPATNFLSRLRAVEPPVPGVELSVVELGNRLQLVNRSDAEVVVMGYEGEPYLRVGPTGVFENRRSPATYLNRDRQASTPVPEDADSSAPPDWQQVSTAREALWFDHRVHWMGAVPPPNVRRAPGELHVIFPEWRVDMRQRETSFAAVGELVWVPGPSPWPWLLLAAVPLGLATLLLGAALWSGSRAWWPRVLAAAVALLVGVNAAGVLARAWAMPGTIGDRVTELASSGPVVVVAWLVGAAAVVLLLRRRPAGLYASLVAAVGIAVFGALLATTDLSRSQVPSALQSSLARATVAWSLGLGAAVALGAMVALPRARRTSATSGAAG